MNAAVPSAAAVIIERLAAGEWECALKLLELPEQAVLPAWQSIVSWRRGSNPTIDIDFADVTRMHQRGTSSLAGLPPALRWRIAEQLLEADDNYSRARVAALERGAVR